MAGQHNTKQAVENQVYEKALKDDAFRQELLQNPKAAIESVMGTKLPDNVNIHVNENTANDIYLSIPAKADDKELTDEELSGVDGGWHPHICVCTNCGEYTSFNPDCTPDC